MSMSSSISIPSSAPDAGRSSKPRKFEAFTTPDAMSWRISHRSGEVNLSGRPITESAFGNPSSGCSFLPLPRGRVSAPEPKATDDLSNIRPLFRCWWLLPSPIRRFERHFPRGAGLSLRLRMRPRFRICESTVVGQWGRGFQLDWLVVASWAAVFAFIDGCIIRTSRSILSGKLGGSQSPLIVVNFRTNVWNKSESTQSSRWAMMNSARFLSATPR